METPKDKEIKLKPCFVRVEKPQEKKVLIIKDLNESMMQHFLPGTIGQIEIPQRIKVITDYLNSIKLMKICKEVVGREAKQEELALAHTPAHLEMIEHHSKLWDDELILSKSRSENGIPPDLYFSKETATAASFAYGSVIKAVNEIITNPLTPRGFCIVRTPGHHAHSKESVSLDKPLESGTAFGHHPPAEPYKTNYNGFCVYNNVAGAAQYCITEHKLNRVLIIDWDIHHGNSTQNTFYDTEKVLYLSIHRSGINTFPKLSFGTETYVGKDNGTGYNVNIPIKDEDLPLGNSDYMEIFNRIVIPIGKVYKPELVLISSGFDGLKEDTCGTELTHSVYYYLTREAMQLCPKTLLVLEGGYSLTELAKCVASCIIALGVEKPTTKWYNVEKKPKKSEQKYHNIGRLNGTIKAGCKNVIRRVIEVQSAYWPCLLVSNHPKGLISNGPETLNSIVIDADLNLSIHNDLPGEIMEVSVSVSQTFDTTPMLELSPNVPPCAEPMTLTPDPTSTLLNDDTVAPLGSSSVTFNIPMDVDINGLETHADIVTGTVTDVVDEPIRLEVTYRAKPEPKRTVIEFRCDVEGCAKAPFKNKKNLVLHKESVHEGIKYNCNHCKKSFSRTDTLNRHMKASHTDVESSKGNKGSTNSLKIYMREQNEKISKEVKRYNKGKPPALEKTYLEVAQMLFANETPETKQEYAEKRREKNVSKWKKK